mgnify:FL=1
MLKCRYLGWSRLHIENYCDLWYFWWRLIMSKQTLSSRLQWSSEAPEVWIKAHKQCLNHTCRAGYCTVSSYWIGKSYYVAAGGRFAPYVKTRILNAINEGRFDCKVQDITYDMAILSVQGPTRYTPKITCLSASFDKYREVCVDMH